MSGILEDIDILGFVAGNSQLVPGRIDRALGLEDLGIAAREIEDQVRLLRRQGVKIEVVLAWALPYAERLRILMPDDPAIARLAAQLQTAAGRKTP